MGSIRLEPKEDTRDKEMYRKLKTAIVDAWAAIDDHRVFWDLDEDENANRIKRAFLDVAREENIPLQVRRLRGERTLELSFEAGSGKPRRTGDTRSRILEVLAEATEPMTRKDIVAQANISPSAWNKQIKDLVDDGSVVKLGHRRDSSYRLPT